MGAGPSCLLENGQTPPTAYLPVEVDFPEMLLVSESTANNSSNYTTVKTGSNRVSVTASKFVIHQMWSGEMEEDSIIPFVPFLRRQLALSLSHYSDSLVLNGDTTNAGTGNINLDDADPADTKHYLAFDGIRHVGLVDNTANQKDMSGAIDLAALSAARGRMVDVTRFHDWGHPTNSEDLVYVADPATADAIAALGINLDAPIERLSAILAGCGMVFLMAPRHHASMRHAAGPRVELGTRTIFNLLGPLANPARVKRQMTGAFSAHWLRPMAETLGRLGTERAWVAHGQGLDELTLAGESQVVELRLGGGLREFTVAPEDAGLRRAPAAALRGGDPAENAAALTALLQGAPGPYRDVVLLNAAAALVVADRAADLREGAAIAARAIDTGAAAAVLDKLRNACTTPPEARSQP